MLPPLSLSHTQGAYTGPLHPQPEPTLAQSIKVDAVMAATMIRSDRC